MLARKKCYIIFVGIFFTVNLSLGAPKSWLDELNNAFKEKIAFFDAFRKKPEIVGSVAPSSRFLAAAITEHVKSDGPPLNILEVGPGTGPFTREIVKKLRPEDSFYAIEFEEVFCTILQEEFKNNKNVRIIHASILDWNETLYPKYFDVIISGLPFKIFSSQDVTEILNKYEFMLKPEGIISYFSYIGINILRKILFCFNAEQKIKDTALFDVLAKFEKRFTNNKKQKVWRNLPPAYVHHLQKVN